MSSPPKIHATFPAEVKMGEEGKREVLTVINLSNKLTAKVLSFYITRYYAAFWKGSSMLKGKSTVSQSYSE